MDEDHYDAYNLADVQSLLGLASGTASKTPPFRPLARPPAVPSPPPDDDVDPAVHLGALPCSAQRSSQESLTLVAGQAELSAVSWQ
jgi:hypothetical protein